MSKINNIYASIVMLAAVLLLTACSRQEPAPAAAAAAPAATPAPVATPTPAPKWLATAQGDVQGVTIAVQELRRRPHTLMLKIAVINRTYYPFSFPFGEPFSTTQLVDEANQKKYFVVKDGEGNPSCSSIYSQIAAGSQGILWAEFPLPPDDVQKINVVVPKFQPMEDVSISR